MADTLRVTIPSRQDRRNVSVESISFLILINASSVIGPHLHGTEERHRAVYVAVSTPTALCTICVTRGGKRDGRVQLFV